MRYFAALVALLILLIVFWQPQRANNPQFGVTFSPEYAGYLNLDWKKVYLDILDNLKVRNLRLPTYWDDLEKVQGKIDFSETDFLLSEAQKKGAKVLLVVGARQPRWPECHYPNWAKSLSVKTRQQKTLEFVKEVVTRYKNNSSIWAYQVENEPFAWWFGENCDAPDSNFLQSEVNLVKSLDPKPVVITDSGEWSLWIRASQNADILGSSVYRKAYNSTLHFYMTYPFPAKSYQLKANFIKKLPFSKTKEVIVTELQSEAWLANDGILKNIDAQTKEFSLNDFKNNLEFVKKIGFSKDYLWGVEWWYFMAKNNHPEYLNFAKTIF